MKPVNFKSYFSLFILASGIIAVYKTFDVIIFTAKWLFTFLTSLTPLYTAFVIAFLMYPVCKKCECFIRHNFPDKIKKHSGIISIITVYVLTGLLISLAIYLVLPPFIRSLSELLKSIPEFLKKISDKLNELPYISFNPSDVNKYIDFSEFLQKSGWLNPETYTTGITGFSSFLANAVLSVIASVYILTDKDNLKNIAYKLAHFIFGNKICEFITTYLKRGISFSYKYVYCLMTDALIVFSILLMIMSVMGIRYAPVLAFTAGIGNLIPYFGSIAAALIIIIVTSVSDGFTTAALLGIIILIVQQLDANVIQPRLVTENLDVKPFWVLVGVLVGGKLFGLWGIVVTVPVLALIRTVSEDFLKHRLNEKN